MGRACQGLVGGGKVKVQLSVKTVLQPQHEAQMARGEWEAVEVEGKQRHKPPSYEERLPWDQQHRLLQGNHGYQGHPAEGE